MLVVTIAQFRGKRLRCRLLTAPWARRRCWTPWIVCGARFGKMSADAVAISHFTTTRQNDWTLVHHVTPVSSTQDEMKKLLQDKILPLPVVIANQQTHGRGTHGRTWEGRAPESGREGELFNLFMTLAIPMQDIPVTATLLPLQVGVVVANHLNAWLEKTNAVATVKWPNDVLIDNQDKISGTLIESHVDSHGVVWLLIGIGVNVAYTPLLHPPGAHGRNPTSLQQVLQRQSLPINTTLDLGTGIATTLIDWVYDVRNNTTEKNHRDQQVVDRWKSLAVLGAQYELRDDSRRVTVVDLSSDGQLIVRDNHDDSLRWLVADYLV
jgi:biotin-[acetyl-CoA-carboxylase] ligase BirA-like protein